MPTPIRKAKAPGGKPNPIQKRFLCGRVDIPIDDADVSIRRMTSRPGSHSANRLATLALLVQLLFPAGYMAGDLASGWYLQVCHYGLPTGVLDHHHHGSGAAEPAQTAEHEAPFCPLGDGYSAADLSLGAFRDDPHANQNLIAWVAESSGVRSRYSRHRPRAPPPPL